MAKRYDRRRIGLRAKDAPQLARQGKIGHGSVRPVKTVIDGAKVPDLRKWVLDKVEHLESARDIMLPSPIANAVTTKHRAFIDRVKANYEYFHDIRSRLETLWVMGERGMG